MTSQIIQQQFHVDQSEAGKRLDQCLAQRLPEYSRSKIQHWIKQHFITLNQKDCVPKQKLCFGDVIDCDVPVEKKIEDKAEMIQFDIVYKDDAFFVINKPVGLVVHPAAGHQSGTLLNGLLALDQALEQLPRAGIVHRLDKDTSGVMVVARTLTAHTHLVNQLQARTVSREYRAVTQNVITAGRTIEEPIGRHPHDRKKMAVVDIDDGKEAITHFSVLKKFKNFSEIKVHLETGRTHQIRVHLAHIRHPLVGDQVYGGRLTLPKSITEELHDKLHQFKRQALHARKLSFNHPVTNEAVSFEADMPEDMRHLLEVIARSDAAE